MSEVWSERRPSRQQAPGARAGVRVRLRPGRRGAEGGRGLGQGAQQRPQAVDCGVSLCSYEEHANVQRVAFYFLTLFVLIGKSALCPAGRIIYLLNLLVSVELSWKCLV